MGEYKTQDFQKIPKEDFISDWSAGYQEGLIKGKEQERNRILEIIDGMNMETSAIYPYLAYNRALEDIKSKLK